MKTSVDDLEALYEYYSRDYTLEWGNDAHGYFYLYFSDKKSRQYRMHVFEEGVALERRSRIIKWYWNLVTHLHFDNDDDTINDVWYGIKILLDKYDDPTKHSVFKRLAQYNNMADWFMDKQSEELKNMDIFHIIKKYVDEYDFYDLLKCGAPGDEYDSESERIASQITKGSTAEEIENVISAVMEKSFAVSDDKFPPQAPKSYRDISEKIKDEMDRSFCSEEIAKDFLGLFPEYEEAYQKHIQEYGGLLGHIFYADLINIPLCNLFENSSDDKLIRKYCEFIEHMWMHGNDADRNVVDVTILEQLSDDEDRWQKLGTNISQDFREHINNELLTENIMMRNVSKI